MDRRKQYDIKFQLKKYMKGLKCMYKFCKHSNSADDAEIHEVAHAQYTAEKLATALTLSFSTALFKVEMAFSTSPFTCQRKINIIPCSQLCNAAT
jgi:hypothetical protein